jgi:hypothetical protein
VLGERTRGAPVISINACGKIDGFRKELYPSSYGLLAISRRRAVARKLFQLSD